MKTWQSFTPNLTSFIIISVENISDISLNLYNEPLFYPVRYTYF